ALMSMEQVFKTRLRRRRVQQSGEFDIEFKIVDEYTLMVAAMVGDDAAELMRMVMMVWRGGLVMERKWGDKGVWRRLWWVGRRWGGTGGRKRSGEGREMRWGLG
nr:hypothetical protein [Tanacetum cinerariifolium]GEZ81489.1 hypothetical protein [Tanacetum cinerariifolium]